MVLTRVVYIVDYQGTRWRNEKKLLCTLSSDVWVVVQGERDLPMYIMESQRAEFFLGHSFGGVKGSEEWKDVVRRECWSLIDKSLGQSRTVRHFNILDRT